MIWLLFPLFRAGFQQGAAAMLTFGRMGATAQISKKSGIKKYSLYMYHFPYYTLQLPTHVILLLLEAQKCAVQQLA